MVLRELPEFQTRWYDFMLGIAADDGNSEAYFRSHLLALFEETGTLAAVLQRAEDYHVPNYEELEGNFQFLMLGEMDSVRGPQKAPEERKPEFEDIGIAGCHFCAR
jgi:hypothetical protein